MIDFVKIKASVMTYWDGCKKTLLPDRTPTELTNLLATSEYNLLPLKNGPCRKLSLEQEFLLPMMRFRLGHWDIHIVRKSRFFNMLQPHDFIMVDRGFKIKTDLAMYQCQLCIPPSAVKGNPMTANAVKETSNVANVRIYVEQAIGRIKNFRILKLQNSLLYLPLMDDIVNICGALVNLRDPLA